MRLVLPYPPSGNLYWRHWRNRVVCSTEARAYKERVKFESLAKRSGRALAGPVRVEVGVYRPRKQGDLDNALKVLLDALKGIAFEDDSQVVELHAKRHDDKTNPRVEVNVTAWEGR